ncbi:type IV pilus modification protein PilV [Moraxellaceae bacterium AER2_44_116]|nr:type IV pilus modification protein PilV [Moraxellaceae bacterium]TQC97766.1 type IV pilus modification protein PilV [Moraxellaceae bacterium AER2_44_116]
MTHSLSLNKNKQKGIGLTEVLVATLLLGIGVIGFSGLQVRAIGATNDSAFRMQAMAVARDAAERMRVNNSAAAMAVYLPATPVAWVSTPANSNLCIGTVVAPCTPASMATFDKSEIAALALAALPNGQVSVATCPNRTNRCVYVSWNTTTPTIGDAVPNCSTTSGVYVGATLPNSTDCVISET